MIRTCFLALGVCAALMAPASRALAVTITIDPAQNNSSVIEVDAIDAGAKVDFGDDRALLTELGDGAVTDTRGPTAADTSYSLSNAAFVFDLDHTRGAPPRSRAATRLNLYFRPDADVEYVFSGWYAAEDPDGRITRFYVGLRDGETGAMVFENFQESVITPDETFLLGLEEGDNFNTLSGSKSGTLIAGRTYQLSLSMYIGQPSAPEGSLSAATATGEVSLRFVPEPGAGTLLALGLLGFAVRARTRHSGPHGR